MLCSCNSKREGRGHRPSARVERGSPARAIGSAGSRGSAVERCLVCPVVRSADGSRLRIGDAGPCDGRAEAGRGRAWVTLLDREIVDSVSIAAATAATLVAGRREERSSVVRGHGRGGSRLVTAFALGVVVLLAAVGVVAVLGLLVPAAPRPRRSRSPFESPDVRTSGVFVWGVRLRRSCSAATARGADHLGVYVGGRELEGDRRVLRLAPYRRCRRDAAPASPAASVALRVRARSRGNGDRRRQAPAPVTAQRALAAAVAGEAAARQEQHHQDDQQHPCPHRHLVTSFVVAVAPCLPVERDFDTFPPPPCARRPWLCAPPACASRDPGGCGGAISRRSARVRNAAPNGAARRRGRSSAATFSCSSSDGAGRSPPRTSVVSPSR